MIGKCVQAALAFACVSAATPPETPPPYHYPMVKQVLCKYAKGTAFRLGDTVVTAAHVSNNYGCTIGGEAFTANSEPGLDFATLEGLPIGRGMKINCDGFKAGEWYHAVGYASGNPWQMTVTVLATWERAGNGVRIMLGYPTFIPGMSGGPVMNGAGEVVGIVNSYWRGQPYSGSRELKDTSLCS